MFSIWATSACPWCPVFMFLENKVLSGIGAEMDVVSSMDGVGCCECGGWGWTM